MDPNEKEVPGTVKSGAWVGLVMIGLVVLIVAIEMFRSS